MKWRQSGQGDNCDRAGLAELKHAVDRLRIAKAQPTDHAAERDSAPRVLLKTACSGAPRVREYERAQTLLGTGQHPRCSVFF